MECSTLHRQSPAWLPMPPGFMSAPGTGNKKPEQYSAPACFRFLCSCRPLAVAAERGADA
tara:strand:- start:21676 stop:21855 length:180 start_codon:yes stop_codon:yes gene_type:complete